MNEMSFAEPLAISLALTIAGTKHEIPGGAVKRLELELELHGFRGLIEFVLQDDVAAGGGFSDELLTDFSTQELADVRIELAPVFDQPEAATSPTPLVLVGLARQRSFTELQLRRSGDQPILARRYRVEFADPARVLWTQHFPCELYTQKTFTDVVDAQLGDRITMAYEWSGASVSQAQWFVHLPVERGASFYDFMFWYADLRGAHLVYDYSENSYDLRGEKDSSTAPLGLFGDDIGMVELVMPPTPAYAVDVINSYAEAARIAPVTNTMAATGIRQAHLLRSPIAQDTDDRVTLETNRLVLPQVEAQLSFARMPVIGLYPGLLIDLLAANRWSSVSYLVGKTWRVQRLSLSAEAPPEPIDADLQLDSTRYMVTLSARLEQSSDQRRQQPSFRPPSYPGYVEGKVVSEKGEAGEKTYQSYRNTDTSLDEYTVAVPVWADQQVTAPFVPYEGSGSVYVPCHRDERVLLAMQLDRSRISRLLVWRDGAALSMDVQGEQILLGISATSNTSLNHVYEDQKPVFNVVRTSAADGQLIKLSEGCMLLHVQEQDQ